MAIQKKAPSRPQTGPAKGELPQAIAVLFLYTLAASLHGALSQLMLSPTYGSLVVSEYHTKITLIGSLLGALLSTFSTSLDTIALRSKIWIPLLPLYFPVLQSFLVQYSNSFGSSSGPLINELITLLPFHMLSTTCICAYLSNSIDILKKQRILHPLIGLATYTAIVSVEPFFMDFLPTLALYSRFLTKTWLSLAISVAGLARSNVAVAVAALPAISHTLQRNPHLEWRPFRALPSVERSGYSLIDRKESITGYISVLENNELAYRVLRCDHSLLGGEWLLTEKAIAQGITGTEPVYAVFEMLEAVRLIETMNKRLDREKKALVIGLGIGTAPKALLAHGIETTIVELDPVVHEFATKYFDLPTNHTAYLEDAIGWTQSQLARGTPQYDYILHDVFTGGAEPLALFTESFITNLRTMLRPDGVIAINYAGSVNAQPAKQVLNTINNVFERHCRMFRDLLPEEDGEESDFVNMVIFCLNPKGSALGQKPVFRQPVQADYLSSVSRKHHLVPNPVNELAFPSKDDMSSEVITTMTEANIGSFSRQQLSSAKKHWKVMREVVVSNVWEQW